MNPFLFIGPRSPFTEREIARQHSVRVLRHARQFVQELVPMIDEEKMCFKQAEELVNNPDLLSQTQAQRDARRYMIFYLGLLIGAMLVDVVFCAAEPSVFLIDGFWSIFGQGGEAPTFLRIFSAVLFTGTLFGITLLCKYATDIRRDEENLRLASDAQAHYTATTSRVFKMLIRIGFLSTLGWLFFTLHSFTGEKAHLSATLENLATSKPGAFDADVNLFEQTSPQYSGEAPISSASSFRSEIGLPQAPALVFIIIYLFHCFLLFLPLPQFGADLSRAGLTPARVDSQWRRIGQLIDQHNTAFWQEVQNCEETALRQKIINLLPEPVAVRINRTFGRIVIEVSGNKKPHNGANVPSEETLKRPSDETSGNSDRANEADPFNGAL